MILLIPAGELISWRQAGLRFITALISWSFLGIGFLWIFLDPKRRAWHDILSGTQIFLIETEDKTS